MVFSIKGFNLVLGVSFELPFLAIFSLHYIRKFN